MQRLRVVNNIDASLDVIIAEFTLLKIVNDNDPEKQYLQTCARLRSFVAYNPAPLDLIRIRNGNGGLNMDKSQPIAPFDSVIIPPFSDDRA